MGRAKANGKGKGKNRQPGKPKRATSAYLYFLSHLRDQLKAQGKSIKIGDLAKEAAEKWHAMDSDTRYIPRLFWFLEPHLCERVAWSVRLWQFHKR